jgi:hypothetical protein
MMNIVAQTEEDIPKYMRLNAKTQYELGQGIEAALEAADVSDFPSKTQACFQLCWQQVLEQLEEEYHLKTPESLGLESIDNQNSLYSGLLKLLALSGIQWQLKVSHKSSLSQFKSGFKLVVARSLLDALDLMNAKGLWRFDIQRSVQQLQKRVFLAVDETVF